MVWELTFGDFKKEAILRNNCSCNDYAIKIGITPIADPIKLLFFTNDQEFFRFSLVSLRVCYIEKKN